MAGLLVTRSASWLTPCLLGLLVYPASAAQLVCTGVGGGEGTGFWLEQACLRARLTASLPARWERCPEALAGLAPVSAGLLGWRGCELLRLSGGAAAALARFAGPVRAVTELAGGTLVLLVGGQPGAGGLERAQVAFWQPSSGQVWPSRAVAPELNPFLLRSARCGRQQVVYVGVRKPAIFDPVRRCRPFVYSYSPARRDLVPRWQGTSLARPYVDVQFADVNGEGEPELCALEEAQGGQRALAVYRWTGHGVEALARGEAAELGDRLVAGPTDASARQALFVFAAAAGRWSAWAWEWGQGEAAPGLAKLVVGRRTVSLGTRPRAWAVGPRGSEGAPPVLVLTRSGPPRRLAWQQVRAKTAAKP